MDWLLFAFALELGAIRGPDIPVDLSSYVQTEATVTIMRHLEIGGSLRSYQIPVADSYSWDPFLADYTLSAVVRFGGLSFGAEHFCRHPVGSSNIFAWQTGGFERAFVRISTPMQP